MNVSGLIAFLNFDDIAINLIKNPRNFEISLSRPFLPRSCLEYLYKDTCFLKLHCCSWNPKLVSAIRRRSQDYLCCSRSASAQKALFAGPSCDWHKPQSLQLLKRPATEEIRNVQPSNIKAFYIPSRPHKFADLSVDCGGSTSSCFFHKQEALVRKHLAGWPALLSKSTAESCRKALLSKFQYPSRQTYSLFW